MGYRANVIVKHREYGSQTFADWDMFVNKFVPAAYDLGLDVIGNDAEDYFEVEKESLQEFVNKLPKDDKESIYPDYTNKELREELQIAIDETLEDWVEWEWL